MGWKKVKIGDVSSQIRGITYTPKDVSEKQLENYLPILRANNIQDIGLNFENVIYVNQKNISKTQLLQEGDIVIAASSGSKAIVGKASTFTQKWLGSFGAFCKVIRPSKNVFAKYLGYYFQSDEYRKKISHLSAGANINNIRNGDLDNLPIIIPPLPTQQRIAAILDKADELRKKDKQLLARYDALLQSVFYDMFGDPILNEKGWEILELKTLFASNPRLGTINPANEQGLIPVVRVGELGELNIAIEKCKKVTLLQNEKERYLLKKNDILLARAIGSLDHLGKASLITNVDNDVVFDSHVMRLQFNQELLNSLFFYIWLQSHGGRKIFLNNSGKTSVQFNINSEQISRIQIALPPITLQNKFAAIAENVQQQKQQVKQQMEQSEKLFQGLLQKAFNGELVA